MKLLFLTLVTGALALSTLSAKDVDIAVTELPKAVTESINKAHPNATLLSAEKDLTMSGDVQHFEVKIRDGDTEKELTVLPDGSIKKTEND